MKRDPVAARGDSWMVDARSGNPDDDAADGIFEPVSPALSRTTASWPSGPQAAAVTPARTSRGVPLPASEIRDRVPTPPWSLTTASSPVRETAANCMPSMPRGRESWPSQRVR